jgi:CelD/BcsL family acetyltransferase involved in cellulose biosynthesis
LADDHVTSGLRTASIVQVPASLSMVAGGALRTRLEPQVDIDRLGADWRELQTRCDHSFFQSWDWIGCLIRVVDRAPMVLSVHDGDRLVGLSIWFDSFSPMPLRRRLALCQLGDKRFDNIYIEHNGVLADRRCADDVIRASLACLRDLARPWLDQFYLGGVGPEYLQLALAEGWRTRVRDRKHLFGLNLDRLRGGNHGHLSLLSRNVRHQIRRSLRFYGGRTAIAAARDVAEALDYLDRLKALHQASWQARGQPGAFAEPFFEVFHRRLIGDVFHTGHLELFRVAGPEEDIGYLYNFIYNGHVYFYQSGFRYFDDNRARPGLLSHHLCIEAHAARGARYYDFMAGTQRYKTDLGAVPAGELTWLELSRPASEYLSASRRRSKTPALGPD